MWIQLVTSGDDEYEFDMAFVIAIATHKVHVCEDRINVLKHASQVSSSKELRRVCV